MIYSASYSSKDHWHGEPICISRIPPKSFKGRSIDFLAPSWTLLYDYKHQGLTQEEYTDRYRLELQQKWRSLVCPWLRSLDPKIDQTVLCYEPKGEFCHRNFVMLMIQKHRPDCYGGRDVSAQGDLFDLC